MFSGMHKWASVSNDNLIEKAVSKDVELPDQLKELKLSENVPEMMESLRAADIVLIEAPSGTGKSVMPPFLLYQLARETCDDPQKMPFKFKKPSFKAAHCGPGVQCIQHTEFLDGMESCIEFGCYTAAVNDKMLKTTRKCSDTTDYVYCTNFFANHIFDGNLYALVIDECHELTPEMMKTLYLAKCAIRNKKIYKLVLLSATISDDLRLKLEEYFNIPNKLFVKLKYDKRPHENNTIFLDDLGGSLMKHLQAYRDDEKLYEEESNFFGVPNSKVLQNRVSELTIQHIIKMDADYIKNKKLPKLPGIVAFVPGEHDVNRTRQIVLHDREFTGRFEYDQQTGLYLSTKNRFNVNMFKISGKDRADLDCLKKVYRSKDPLRVINSSPLLAMGVTLHGVGAVVDDCTMKVPHKYNHVGILSLTLMWQDGNMIMQKKGRAGRQGNGVYYPAISKERFEELLKVDHTMTRLDRGYKTNDVCFILRYRGRLMIDPENDTLKELLIDMWNSGFLKIPAIIPTCLAESLSALLSTIPLVLGDILLRCFAFGIGLHGLVFVGSCMEDHRALRGPTYEGRGSRDDDELPILLWHRESNAAFNSDMELMTEIVFNLIMIGPLHLQKVREEADHKKKCKQDEERRRENGDPPVVYPPYKHEWITPQIPDKDRFMVPDATFNTMRHVMMGFSCLSAAAIAPKYFRDFLLQQLYSNYYITNRNAAYGTNVFKIQRMRDDQSRVFRAILLQSLGSKVVYEGSEEDQDASRGKRKMFVNPKVYNIEGSFPALVQGELPVYSPSHIAVYYQLTWRSKRDTRVIGLLHYVSTVEYILFGNVIAANIDEVNLQYRILKISTNTFPFFIQFRNVEVLKAVVNCRRIFNVVSSSMIMARDDVVKNHEAMMNCLTNVTYMLYGDHTFKKLDLKMKMDGDYSEASEDDGRSARFSARRESAVYSSSNQESDVSGDDRKAAPRFNIGSSLSQMSFRSDSSAELKSANLSQSRQRRGDAARSCSNTSTQSRPADFQTQNTQDSKSIRYNEVLQEEPPVDNRASAISSSASLTVVQDTFEINGLVFTGDVTIDAVNLNKAMLFNDKGQTVLNYWKKIRERQNKKETEAAESAEEKKK
ncbi:hypothetical protein PRIPAC_76515 [Pristionchus pacificus]|uniref:Helicase ATP-binding domain-containing protein n=1 Tax=Pristionchus pacificus TaxID=54126 RepID=A0A2A6C8R1_PRIPA|nr:hypothetical protein PRIPAC_76515 [Pristionchus pacificus]|eukprot:PDM74411.1 hypothetical protein PRIPAC_41767 [Pristionchus pacificus]